MNLLAVLRRRPWLAGGLLLALALCALLLAQQARSAWNVGVAYRYALPLYEVMHLRYSTLYDPRNPHRVHLNQFGHKRTLAGAQDRLVTMPNNDTLYSLAVLDLSAGPVRLDVPDTGGRYYSAALMDAYTNNFSIIGRRTTGTKAASFAIAGPGWQGDTGNIQLIHSPTNTVLLLVRLLVDGPDDLAAANALQDGFKLSAPSQREPAAPVWPADSADGFLAVVDAALEQDPPPGADTAVLKQIARYGIGPGIDPAKAPRLAAWHRWFPLARRVLVHAVSRPRKLVDGWNYLPGDLGNYGTDYDVRAAVALFGLMALPPEEAMYTNGLADSHGHHLSGTHRYRLHLPPGGVPADAFWSLSLYTQEADGRAYFSENPLHRYAIGNRTQGLKTNADGSLDILIQHDAPQDPSNWLPAPESEFRLTMRAYQPRRELLDGSFRYPGIERLAD